MPVRAIARNSLVDVMTDHEEQFGFDLGDAGPTTGVYAPNLGEVREDLDAILGEARAATDISPWDARTARYNKIVFIQLTKWLPDEEAEQYCFAFHTEYERIEALLAA